MDETNNAVLKGKLVQLDAYKLEQFSNIKHNGLWVTKGRLGFGMNEMFRCAALPVLMPGTHAAELVMIHTHNQHHMGTLWRSHRSTWITKGKELAKRVSNNCYECRRRRALVKRIVKCKPFTNIQVDLSGDVKVKAMCNSRATLKTYPITFVCMNTGAMQAYDASLCHASLRCKPTRPVV